MMHHKSIVHLLSGGLDSVTMLYDLHAQDHMIHCLMVDYGQRHAQELVFAKGHCHRLGVLYTAMQIPSLGGLTESDSWIVPNRNMVLLSLAVSLAVRAKADTVTIGCNFGDAKGFLDCRPNFICAIKDAVRLAGYGIEVCAPYIAKAKWEIADLSKQLGVPSHELWTCYKGGARPCGECPACVKLAEAFATR